MDVRKTFLVPTIAVMVASSAVAFDGPMDIRANDAIHIVFPTDLRADVNRPGDGFYADVDHDPLLPDHARLYGHVLSVHPATPRTAASMRMEFDTLEMPSGDRINIEAIPIALNDPHLTRGTNGRLVAQYKPGEQAAYTVGGAAGGLLVGGLLHRPFAGAFLGALIGSIAGHEDRAQKQNLIVAKGDHLAALFEADVSVTASQAPAPPPVPGGGWRFREGGPTQPAYGPAYAGRLDIRTTGGQPVRFVAPLAPYRVHGTLMVPLDQAAEKFGVDVTHEHSGQITLDGPDRSLHLWNGSTRYEADNGRTGDLRVAVQERHGAVYIPIEAFATVKHDAVTVNGRPVPPLP
jgi:hypothetical protein